MISLTPVQWLITKSVGYMIDNSSDLNWNHLMKKKLLLQLNIKTICWSIFNFEKSWKIFLFSFIVWSSWENCTKNQSYICDRLNMIFVFSFFREKWECLVFLVSTEFRYEIYFVFLKISWKVEWTWKTFLKFYCIIKIILGFVLSVNDRVLYDCRVSLDPLDLEDLLVWMDAMEHR